MDCLQPFSEITRENEPLAPYTWLKLGGPAQYLMEPRSVDELGQIILTARENQIPVYVLGGGSNLLVRDEGVGGIVVRLVHGEFTDVSIEGTILTIGAGVMTSHAISRAVAAGLTGLESLAGIPGTIGGAIMGNAGGRAGDIGTLVSSVTIMTHDAKVITLSADEITFQYRSCNIDAVAILKADLQLTEGDPSEITKRLRKMWIMKKSTQPLSSQSAGCLFKNPRGLSAGSLIEQSGLKGTRVGDCEVSDLHANFVFTHEDASSEDLLKLIDLIKTKVKEEHEVDLELEIAVWPSA